MFHPEKKMLKLDKPATEYTNPEFIEMARYITDEYWQQKMILAASGKFPRKISYRNGEIRFRKPNGMITETVCEDSSEAANMVIKFIKKYTGLSSATDNLESLKRIKSASDRYKPLSECGWKDLNKGSKIALINRYADEVTNAMSLSRVERCNLIKVIQCGLTSSRLTHNHIQMHGGRICKVEGLVYNSGVFGLDPNEVPYKHESVDPRIIIDLDAKYKQCRYSKSKVRVPLGSMVENVTNYLSLKLTKDNPSIIPTFVILNDPNFDLNTSSNEIHVKSDTDNWSVSPESYDSISNSFER